MPVDASGLKMDTLLREDYALLTSPSILRLLFCGEFSVAGESPHWEQGSWSVKL
jgi:hypothetical protein